MSITVIDAARVERRACLWNGTVSVRLSQQQQIRSCRFAALRPAGRRYWLVAAVAVYGGQCYVVSYVGSWIVVLTIVFTVQATLKTSVVVMMMMMNEVKVARTGLPSVGLRSCSRFLAVSLQVTWVINPAVGCHYFSPGPQLPSQPLRGLLPISVLGEQRHDGCEQFA